MLALLCSETLAALPTSLGEDERILASADCAQRYFLAVAWRAGYKRALCLGVQRAQVALSTLEK